MMFDLDTVLLEWRRAGRRHGLSRSELAELEDHLMSSFLEHRRRGARPADAFAVALRALGPVAAVSAEYRKVRRVTWSGLLKTAWAAFAVAFFLPVVDGGIMLAELNLEEGLLPGFQAISIAFEEGGWMRWSALSNLLLLATLWRVRDLGRVPVALLAVAVSGGMLLNGWWLTEFGAFTDLRVGYYMWWGSFGLAASALMMRARELWAATWRRVTA